MALLEVENLRAGYDGVPVLQDVNLSADEGRTTVLLGLNGAGKTTTMLCVAGMLRAQGGSISFRGKPLGKESPAERVKKGIVLVPEGRRLFPNLTVEENLRVGGWTKRRDANATKVNFDLVYGVFPLLAERRSQMAGTLSGGEQQMLAIARGLMAGPRLLLVDEASLGLAPRLAQEVFGTLHRLTEQGMAVLMVEQNVGVLELADTAYLMDRGRVVASGTGAEIQQVSDLRRVYLGLPD